MTNSPTAISVNSIKSDSIVPCLLGKVGWSALCSGATQSYPARVKCPALSRMQDDELVQNFTYFFLLVLHEKAIAHPLPSRTLTHTNTFLSAKHAIDWTFTPNAPDSARLIILPGEDDPSMPSTSRGRPIGQEYYEIKEKIAFMDLHKIDKSVISLANPWLDFLPAEEAGEAAKKINDDVNDQCSQYPGRLYFFGTLPLSASPEVITAEIERLSTLKYARGVIMGTSGLGQGLDDAKLDPVYAALEKHQQLIFLHPHYGLPASVYGPRASEYGHVLPLALGFPLETTIAVSRMLLSGVWDRFTKLSVLLAHSGGTLPFLAGRIESCILHDGHLKKHGKTQNRRDVWDILKTNIYLDAVIYSEVGLKAALDASGSDRLLFGTDHPFFPPLEEDAKEWHSVNANYGAISKAFATDDKKAQDVLGGNAVRILRLD
ncbi:hypothetical protein BM1_07253 [Bipolaris maydis]|nr:hypothetical protein BM1_07253 [Bipolaris maydis]